MNHVMIMWKNRMELEQHCRNLQGKKIAEIASQHSLIELDRQEELVFLGKRKYIDKQLINDIIEKDYFNTPKNNSPDPDIVLDNGDKWELKVSHTTMAGHSLVSPKFRLVLKMLDYHDVASADSWRDSKLYNKLRQMVVVYYHLDRTKSFRDLRIICAGLYDATADENLIEEDFTIMRENVNNGIRISERHHTFLASCPKHSGGFNKKIPALSKANSLSSHPNFTHAEKRGFCIKREGSCKIFTDMLGIEMHYVGKSYGARISEIPWLN